MVKGVKANFKNVRPRARGKTNMVITRVDLSPTQTERLRLIPVSFRKIMDSRKLTIQLKTRHVFSTVHSFHMECKSTE